VRQVRASQRASHVSSRRPGMFLGALVLSDAIMAP